MEEIWKDVCDYEGLYQISNTGRIRSVTRIVQNPRPRKLAGRILKTRVWGNNPKVNYHMISLSKSIGNGKFKSKGFLIHRLVLSAFVPNTQNLPVANHKDGDKFNNHIDNLEWVTHKENVMHAVSTGLMGGERNRLAKVTIKQVIEIKKLLALGNRQVDIAKTFNVPPKIICFIKTGRSWKNVVIPK